MVAGHGHRCDVLGVGLPDIRDVEVAPDVTGLTPHGQEGGSNAVPKLAVVPVVLEINRGGSSIVGTRSRDVSGISEDPRVFVESILLLVPGPGCPALEATRDPAFGVGRDQTFG